MLLNPETLLLVIYDVRGKLELTAARLLPVIPNYACLHQAAVLF